MKAAIKRKELLQMVWKCFLPFSFENLIFQLESNPHFCIFELQEHLFFFGSMPNVSVHSNAFGRISRELPAAGLSSKNTGVSSK